MFSDTKGIRIGAFIYIKQDAFIRIRILKLYFFSCFNLCQRCIFICTKEIPLQKIAFVICYSVCLSGITTAVYRFAKLIIIQPCSDPSGLIDSIQHANNKFFHRCLTGFICTVDQIQALFQPDLFIIKFSKFL